jgi:hypothetical protein
MDKGTRLKYLQLSLRIFGGIFTFAVYPLTVFWPSGWSWHGTGTSHYLTMIIGHLYHPWHLPFHRIEKPVSASQFDLVHGLVEHRPRGNHGCAGGHESRTHRSSVRRCAGSIPRCRHIGMVDAENSPSHYLTYPKKTMMTLRSPAGDVCPRSARSNHQPFSP